MPTKIEPKVGYAYEPNVGTKPVIVTQLSAHGHSPERCWCCVQGADIGWYTADEFRRTVRAEIGPVPTAKREGGGA